MDSRRDHVPGSSTLPLGGVAAAVPEDAAATPVGDGAAVAGGGAATSVRGVAAAPHASSGDLCAVDRRLAPAGVVVDLAADFRLQDPALYPTWYGEEHPAPELLPEFAYGLPELFRDDLVGATVTALPTEDGRR